MVRSPTRTTIVLSAGAATGVGMARFGFGPVLPAMVSDLGWSFTTAGVVQSTNLAAYLVGSLLTPRILGRYGAIRSFRVAYLATAATLVLSGTATAIPYHVVLRVTAGVAAAILWIGGGMIATRLATDSSSGVVIGMFFAGLGPGMAVTGALIPIAFSGQEGWRIVWFVMGAMAIGVAPLVMRALRHADPPAAVNLSDSSTPIPRGEGGSLRRLEFAYFLFGLGSIGYMTFAVALLRQQSVPPGGISAFWIAIGIAIWTAGRLWALPISRSRSGRLAGLMYLMMAMASGAIALSDSFVVVLSSAIVFGGVFVATVAATTHLIRRNVRPHRWTAVFARFTVGFGLALTVGSAATGALADNYGLTTGVATSAAALGAAAVAAAFQPDPEHHRRA